MLKERSNYLLILCIHELDGEDGVDSRFLTA
jgi:hypothetical protein